MSGEPGEGCKVGKQLGVIESDDGHDAFLLEHKQVGDMVGEFLKQV